MSTAPNTHHVVGTGPSRAGAAWLVRRFARVRADRIRADAQRFHVRVHGLSRLWRHARRARHVHRCRTRSPPMRWHLPGPSRFHAVQCRRALDGRHGRAAHALARAGSRAQARGADPGAGVGRGVRRRPDGRCSAGAADNPHNRFAIIDFTTGNRLSPAWITSIVDYSLAHATRDAIDRYLTAWAKTDFSATIRGMSLPVKVIVGEHDPALNAAVMQATFLEHYPACELEVMANAGQYPMHETPVALATSIEKTSCAAEPAATPAGSGAHGAAHRCGNRLPRRVVIGPWFGTPWASTCSTLSMLKCAPRTSSPASSSYAIGIDAGNPDRARSEYAATAVAPSALRR